MDKNNRSDEAHPSQEEQGNIAEVLAELKAFRKGKRLAGESVRDMIEQGRRSQDPFTR